MSGMRAELLKLLLQDAEALRAGGLAVTVALRPGRHAAVAVVVDRPAADYETRKSLHLNTKAVCELIPLVVEASSRTVRLQEELFAFVSSGTVLLRQRFGFVALLATSGQGCPWGCSARAATPRPLRFRSAGVVYLCTFCVFLAAV